MGQVKTDAAYYRTENGVFQLIGADEIWSLHCSPYGMDRREFSYYSIHPGEVNGKMEMCHCHNTKGTNWFSLKTGQDEKYARLGGGESVCHELVKKAFLEISGTTIFNLEKETYCDITLSDADDEYPVVDKNNSKYYIDVFAKFESNNRLSMKWGGVIGIEIRHKHPLPVDKINALRAMEIPIIEYEIPEFIVENAPKEKLNNENRNREFIEFVKPHLQKQINVYALSNPDSKEYLRDVLKEKTYSLVKLEKEMEGKHRENENLSAKYVEQNRECITLRNQLSEKNKDIYESKIKLNDLNTKLSAYNEMTALEFVERGFIKLVGRKRIIVAVQIIQNIVNWSVFIGGWVVLMMLLPVFSQYSDDQAAFFMKTPYKLPEFLINNGFDFEYVPEVITVIFLIFWSISLLILSYKVLYYRHELY